MRRKLVNFLTALSLLMCVAVVVLWVKSFRSIDDLAYTRMPGGLVDGFTSLDSFGGRLMFHWDTRTFTPPHAAHNSFGDPERGGWSVDSTSLTPEDVRFYVAAFERTSSAGTYFRLRRLGFVFGLSRYEDPRIDDYGVSRSVILIVPHAFAAAVFAALPLAAMRHLLRRRHLNRAGRCAVCEYDLRATPDCCPECGTPAAGGVGEMK